MMDKFNEFYMMQNQAKKFEQGGLDDKALELYLKIVDEYLPNSDYSFDRAATLLEKKFKYTEAIAICEKALEKIRSGDVPGDTDKFQQKIDRMKLKAKKDGNSEPAKGNKEPEIFHFGIPGFRTTSKSVMILGSAYYALAAFASYPDQLYTFLFLFSMAFVGSYGAELMMKLSNNRTCTKAFAVTLIALIIAGYSVAQLPQIKAYWDLEGTQQSEGDGIGDGTGDGTEEPADTDRIPPEIPEKYLESAAKSAEKHPASDNALITVENGQILISLVVKAGASQESIDAISEEMIRTLGGLMITENLKGPTDESLGELYDFYSVGIQVTDTLEQAVNEGSVSRSASEIKWVTP